MKVPTECATVKSEKCMSILECEFWGEAHEERREAIQSLFHSKGK